MTEQKSPTYHGEKRPQRGMTVEVRHLRAQCRRVDLILHGLRSSASRYLRIRESAKSVRSSALSRRLSSPFASVAGNVDGRSDVAPSIEP